MFAVAAKPKRRVRHELLEILIDFASSHNGAVPTRRAWWIMAKLQGYQMCQTTFDAHVNKLEAMDRLISFKDGVIVINKSRWEYLKADLVDS